MKSQDYKVRIRYWSLIWILKSSIMILEINLRERPFVFNDMDDRGKKYKGCCMSNMRLKVASI